jgi:GxxExxY protein
MISSERDPVTDRVIGLAIEVHRQLGPGLLESVYEECLCYEMQVQGIPYRRQVQLPIQYKGVHLECGHRMDIVVDEKLIIEIKSVDKLLPLHEAQLLTYLKLSGIRTGLLLNFNAMLLKDGIKRMVL